MKNSMLYILFLAIFTFYGCTGRCGEELSEVELLIEEKPDSALSLLQGIDRHLLQDEYHKSKYGLLLTQAMIKNGIHIDNDSLIGPAVEYFLSHGSESERMKALFYEARVLFNNRNYSQSMTHALPAYEISKRTGDCLWRARLAELLSDLYNHSYHAEKALPFGKEAMEFYKMAGKESNHLYASIDYAMNLIYSSENPERSIALIDSVLRIAEESPLDTFLIIYCQKPKLDFLIKSGKYKEALPTVKVMLELGDESNLDVRDFTNMSRIFRENGLLSEADSCLDMANEISTGPIDVLLLMYDNMASLDSLPITKDVVISYADSIIALQNKYISEVLKESVVVAEGDYYNNIFHKEKEYNTMLWYILAVIIISGILIIACLVYAYRAKMKIKRLELDTKIEEIKDLTHNLLLEQDKCHSIKEEHSKIKDNDIKRQEYINNLQQQIVENKEHSDEIKKAMGYSFKDRLLIINSLCNEYMKSSKPYGTLAKRLSEEIGKLGDDESLAKIETTVNLYRNNIIEKYRKQCSWFLGTDDFKFLILFYAGFSHKALSMLMSTNLKTTYTRKYRIYNAIEEFSPADKTIFLNDLKPEKDRS